MSGQLDVIMRSRVVVLNIFLAVLSLSDPDKGRAPEMLVTKKQQSESWWCLSKLPSLLALEVKNAP